MNKKRFLALFCAVAFVLTAVTPVAMADNEQCHTQKQQRIKCDWHMFDETFTDPHKITSLPINEAYEKATVVKREEGGFAYTGKDMAGNVLEVTMEGSGDWSVNQKIGNDVAMNIEANLKDGNAIISLRKSNCESSHVYKLYRSSGLLAVTDIYYADFDRDSENGAHRPVYMNPVIDMDLAASLIANAQLSVFAAQEANNKRKQFPAGNDRGSAGRDGKRTISVKLPKSLRLPKSLYSATN